jgi:hypothetical protein
MGCRVSGQTSALASALLVGTLAGGCSRGPKPTPETDPPSHVPAPVSSAGLRSEDLRCERDDDCVVCSDGQCGEAMSRRRVATRGAECHQGALCEPWNAVCRGGRCLSVPPPPAERCVHNSDCVTCFDGSPCGQPMARARMAALGARCNQPTRGDCRKLELVCHAGRCLDPKLLEY